jgi:putative hydrolase of the HAD superfamily
MKSINPIQFVLLDLGGIVFELNWQRVEHLVGYDSKTQGQPLSQLIRSWDVYDQYERGLISNFDFFRSFKTCLNFLGTLEELEHHWNQLIATPIHGIEDLLEQVAQQSNLFALSNTNIAHYKYILNNFKLHRKFKKIFTSFEIGLRKPEAAIFAAVLSELNTQSDSILFVDDTIVNLESAKKIGIHSEYCLNSSQDLSNIFKKYKII